MKLPFSWRCFTRKSWGFFRAGALVMFIILLSLACSGKKEVVKQDETFDPEKSIAKANDLIDNKEYDDARRILLEVKNRDLTKKYSPLAQLKIADSYVREEEYDLAAEEYKKFLEMYPDHKDASYAQYQIAMTYFVQIESPERGYGAAAKALEEFEKLKRMYPRNPYREVIELRIDKCKTTMADYEFTVAEFYFNKGSYQSALGRYKQLLTKFPDYKKEPRVLYQLALSCKKLGDKDKTAEYLNLLIAKYPDDKLAKQAQKELTSLAK